MSNAIGIIKNGQKTLHNYVPRGVGDYVEVVGDGVKTYSTLFGELYNLVDVSKLSSKSMLDMNGMVLSNSYDGINYAGITYMASDSYSLVTIKLRSAVYSVSVTRSNGTTFTDYSSNIPTSGEKIRLYYNRALPVYGSAIGTTYNNTQSGLSSTNVQGAIDELKSRETKVKIITVTSPTLTSYSGTLGGYTGTVTISSSDVPSTAYAIIPLGCQQSTDGNRLGTLFCVNNLPTNLVWRINGGTASTYICKFMILYF